MWGSFEFEPTEDDWRRIETAYPFLSPADRDEISRMATDYLMHVPFESYAPKAVDAMAWLVEVEKAAKVFLNVWHKRARTEEKELAVTYARCLVERHIGHHFLPRGIEWHALSGIMTHVVAAFAIAKCEMKKEPRAGFVEGQMWDDLVCRLTDWQKG